MKTHLNMFRKFKILLMKKLFTLLNLAAIICIASNANAQLVTISETFQLPVIGDSIHYVDANSFGFDPTGTGPVTAKVWDESALLNTGTTYDFTYVDPTTIPTSLGKDSFPTATIARGESGAPGYFYYQNTANDINRIGWFSSNSNYGIYTDGTFATDFHFPVTAGQTFTSTYHGNYAPFNVGEDSVRITSGTLSINADMQGQLILPTATFNDVLRLHVVESFHIQTFLLGFVLIDNLIEDDYYYWFHDTVLQPILISGVTTVDGNAQPGVLRYQPVSIPTDIKENHLKAATVYPNPSNGKFIIKNYEGSGANSNLEIFNVLGEKINYTEIRSQSSDAIDISGYPKGIYIVKIYSEQNMLTEKIVIN